MFQKLISSLLSHKKVAVFSHVRPDGDCIGSQIALCLWLQKNGIDAVAYNEDSVNKNLEWLTSFLPIHNPTEEAMSIFDAFVFVDGNALHRFGKHAEMLSESEKPLYMIDHHPQPDDIFEEFVSDVGASSTCELIYNLYEKHEPSQIDEQAAKAMYTGLVTDTGSFQFDSVKPNTLMAAAKLLQYGNFSPAFVVQKLYSSKPMRQLKLLGMALETISLHENKQIATMYVTQAMFEETRTTSEDTEGLVSYPLSIEGVKACVFFRESSDGIKLSLRSQSDINVNEWARKLNGGGHAKASGAWFDGTLEEAIPEVLKVGRKQWTKD